MKQVEIYNYRLAEDGRVFNKKTGRELHPHVKRKNGRIMAVILTIQTSTGRRVVNYARFVYESFYGPINDRSKVVKHKDNNPLNNAPINLVLVEIEANRKELKLQHLKDRKEKIELQIKEMEME